MFCIFLSLALSGFRQNKKVNSSWGIWFKLSGKSYPNFTVAKKISSKTNISFFNISDYINSKFNDALTNFTTERINEIFHENYRYIKNSIDDIQSASNNIISYVMGISSGLFSDQENKTKQQLINFSDFPNKTDILFTLLVSFGVFMFVALLIFGLIYSIVAVFGCCCCKRAKKADWPGIIANIFFWFGIALFLIGSICRLTGIKNGREYGNFIPNLNDTICKNTKEIGSYINIYVKGLLDETIGKEFLNVSIPQFISTTNKTLDISTIPTLVDWIEKVIPTIKKSDGTTQPDYKDKTLMDSIERILDSIKELQDEIEKVKQEKQSGSSSGSSSDSSSDSSSGSSDLPDIPTDDIDKINDTINDWSDNTRSKLDELKTKYVNPRLEEVLEFSQKTSNQLNDLADRIIKKKLDPTYEKICKNLNLTNVEKAGKKIRGVITVLYLFTFFCSLVVILCATQKFYGHGCCAKCRASCTCCNVLCCSLTYTLIGVIYTALGCIIYTSFPAVSSQLDHFSHEWFPNHLGQINVFPSEYETEIANETITVSKYSIDPKKLTGSIVQAIWPDELNASEGNKSFFTYIYEQIKIKDFLNNTALKNGHNYTKDKILFNTIMQMSYNLIDQFLRDQVDNNINSNFNDITYIQTPLKTLQEKLKEAEEEVDKTERHYTEEQKKRIKDRIKVVNSSIYCNESNTDKCLRHSYDKVFYPNFKENIYDNIFVESKYYQNINVNASKILYHALYDAFPKLLHGIYKNTIGTIKRSYIVDGLNIISSPFYHYEYRAAKNCLFSFLSFFGLFITAISIWIRREGMQMPDKVKEEDDDQSGSSLGESDVDTKTKYSKSSSSGSDKYSNSSKRSYSVNEYSKSDSYTPGNE